MNFQGEFSMIEIQKSMYIDSQLHDEIAELYQFRNFYYGPRCNQLDGDIEDLYAECFLIKNKDHSIRYKVNKNGLFFKEVTPFETEVPALIQKHAYCLKDLLQTIHAYLKFSNNLGDLIVKDVSTKRDCLFLIDHLKNTPVKRGMVQAVLNWLGI